MTWPIQRQSDQYEALNGNDLRFAKEYETRDLPEGLVNMLGKGVGITAGLNDPRRMRREADLPANPTVTTEPSTVPGSAGAGNPIEYGGPESSAAGASESFSRTIAVNTRGMDPYSEAYHGHPEGGYRMEQHGFGPPELAEEERYERNAQGIEDDDASGYNWGPEPHHYTDEAFREEPQTQLQPLDDMLTQVGPPTPPEHRDYYAQFGPHLSFMTALPAEEGPAQKTGLAAPATTPAVVPGWVGHGYVPGHRVGLPWRDQIIPGTVTHLDGQEVGVGWDDGQHSTEEPADLRPL